MNTSKSAAEKGFVEVSFAGAPKEFLHFNAFWVEKKGEFINISLGYLEENGILSPFFRGVIWILDLEILIKEFQRYIERIGAPSADKIGGKHPSFNIAQAPISINNIGCASRANWGEITIHQFAHKSAADWKKTGPAAKPLEGITHGAYISTIEIHKKLIYELIIVATSP